MIQRIRVLVFPCGSENASEIHQALRHSVHVELFGASSVEDHGRFRFERYIGGLPNVRDEAFDEAFASLIQRLRIDMVFATHDTVHERLATMVPQLKFFLVNGDPHAAAVARSKSLTYALFSDCGWIPRVFESVASVSEWPVIVKPDAGQGGQSVALAHGPDEAARVAADMDRPVLVEFLPGEELTIDCFSDRNRGLVWVGPRTRERVRAGITMRSALLDPVPAITDIASTINARLCLRGPWFFQLKRDRHGRWKLLELSCRVSGAMVAQRAAGVNLPLMAVQDYLGRSLTALPNAHVKLIERSIATKAELQFDYDTIFVDLDDTLVCGNFANATVIAFLYQSVREGRKIKLITRHERDVAQTLKEARISPELFDEIIHLRDGIPKSDFVTDRSIFIDNHFPERLEVARKRAIPVLDVDALEFFMT